MNLRFAFAKQSPDDACRSSRTPLRRLLTLALAALALAALAFAGATTSPAQESAATLDFRRAYVPRAEVQNVGADLVPLPRDRFEKTIQGLRDKESAVRPSGDQLESALWIGVYDGESVQGIARWTPPRLRDHEKTEPGTGEESDASTSRVASASLGVTDLFLDVQGVAGSASRLPREALEALGSRDEAAAAIDDQSAGSSLALYVRADGKLGAEFPDRRAARLAWSGRTVIAEERARVATWRLPEALRTSMWLIVPSGVEVVAETAWLVEQIPLSADSDDPADSAPRIYRLAGQATGKDPLKIRFVSTKEPLAEDLLYRVANRYVRSVRGLDVEYDLKLDDRSGLLKTLRWTLPANVTPFELTQDASRLELVRGGEKPATEGATLVEWSAELVEPIAASHLALRLRGAATLEPTADRPLPQLRVIDGTWAGESSSIVAEAPLEIQGVLGVDCVAVTEPRPASSASERYRHRSEDSTLACTFGRPPGRSSVDSTLSLRARSSSLEASLVAEVSVAEGPTFEKEIRLLRPWSLDRIEVEPAGTLLDWAIEARDVRSQTIRMRFRDGIRPGETIRLRCDAHVRIDDRDATMSGETLRAFEFARDVRENRAIALFDDASLRFLPVRIADWRTLARDELTAAQRAAVGTTIPRALLPDDAEFRAMEFAFEAEASRLEARSSTSLARSGASVAGRIRVDVVSLSAPIERLQVAFSSPLPPGSRWSSSQADDVPFETQRLVAADAASGAGEVWELVFARPVSESFSLVVAYEMVEESVLVAPLAAVPSAATQRGRFSVAIDLLEDREVVGIGLERVPTTAEEDGESAPAVRFAYDPARRHAASAEPSEGKSRVTTSLVGPARLETEVSSVGLRHVLTYRVSAPVSRTRLYVDVPKGTTLDEIVARSAASATVATGDRRETVRNRPAGEGRIEVEVPRGVETIRMRYFQPLSSLALWSDERVSLPSVEGLKPGAIEWTVRSRGAIAFDLKASGWTRFDAREEGSSSVEAAGAADDVFLSASTEVPLSLTIYRSGAILQAAWILFFATAAAVWASSTRVPVACAVSIGTAATALAFLPDDAQTLRWGALYGAAAGIVCGLLFRSANATSIEARNDRRPLAAATSFLLVAVAGLFSTRSFGQEIVAAPTPPMTYRLLIPVDGDGRPSGDYYYAAREFYDRFLAAERELARPQEEWRIVDAVYEGVMSPGLIDGTPRLSQFTLRLEIETFADDVAATLPLDRKYAEFAGMMEDAGAGGVEVDWNEAGDALSLTFERKGRRELTIPFYPLADPALPAGSRSAKILAIPWAKLFLTGPAEALDDLSVEGSLGAGVRRPDRQVAEFDLGPASRIVFASQRAAAGGSGVPSARWNAGLTVVGDPDACRIEARVVGEAPLGVAIERASVGIDAGWILEAPTDPEIDYQIVAVASTASGPSRALGGSAYEVVFDSPKSGSIAFEFVLRPRGSAEAGMFRTPLLLLDGAPPAMTFASLVQTSRDAAQGGATASVEWRPTAPGRAAAAREIPLALDLAVEKGAVRALAGDESALFAIVDRAAISSHAIRAEYFVTHGDLAVRYEVAVDTGAVRWMQFDLPAAVEVDSVIRRSGTTAEPLAWRRDGRKLLVRLPDAQDDAGEGATIAIDAAIRRRGEEPISLTMPQLRDATQGEIDVRVYRSPELDVSIEAPSGWTVDPTFVPGAFVEGKGRGTGAFLFAAAAGLSQEPTTEFPLLRVRRAAPGVATIWTSVSSRDGQAEMRCEFEIDPTSGPIDRLAIEAPATLGDPVVVSPAGTLTVRSAPSSERRFWVFVPTRPISPGASAILTATLETGTSDRIVVRSIRPLNVRTQEGIVLLPDRLDESLLTWSVTNLQAAPPSDRILERAAALGADVRTFRTDEENFSARARRLETDASSPFAVRWTERRVRFDAPDQYQASVSWDVLPQQRSLLRIAMPAGTTPVALRVDDIPCRWTPTRQGLDVRLVPSALPFRLTLSYRGKLPATERGQISARTTIVLDSPSIGEQASRGEAWIVEATPTAPWSVVDEVDSAGTLEYVDARLAAFEATFAATARAETCTPEELRAYAERRLLDLAELKRRALQTSASDRRDELLARIDAAAAPFGGSSGASDAAQADAASVAALSKASDGVESTVASDSVSLMTESGAVPLAMRVGQEGQFSRIELVVESRGEPRPFPWRRVAETAAIVLICLATARFGSRLLKWFEQMPLQTGSLALVLLAPLFVPSGWLVPTIVIGFLALVAVAARRWVLPLLPHRPRAARTS